MGRRIVSIPLAMLVIALTLAPVAVAGGSQAWIVNPLDVSIRVEVGGSTHIIGPGGSLPASPGSMACLLDEVVYTGLSSRLVLDSWIHDGVVERGGKCIVLGEGRYEPYYVNEYLVQVDLGFMAEGIWARQGEVVTYTAPREVILGDVMYRFVRWKSAVDPDNLTLVIPVYGPVRVEAVYEELVRVALVGPEGRLEEWAKPGKWSLIPVEPVIRGPGFRLVLAGIEALGGEARLIGSYVAVKPGGPMLVHLNYTRYYEVVVKSPLGHRVEWVREGGMYTVKVESVIDVGPDRRLVFDGMYVNGSLAKYPVYTLEVDGPVRVEVDYVEEVLVRVLSPLGVQEHWRRVGDKMAVYQPPTLSGIVYERVLDHYLVGGVPREPDAGGVLVITVQEPVEVVPVYVERLALRNLAALAMVIGSGLIIYYVVVSTVYRQKRSDREEPRL